MGEKGLSRVRNPLLGAVPLTYLRLKFAGLLCQCLCEPWPCTAARPHTRGAAPQGGARRAGLGCCPLCCWLWRWSCNWTQKRSRAGDLQHRFSCYQGTCGVVGFGAGGFLALKLTSTHRELRVCGCADGCGAGPWDAEGHHPAATTHGAGVGAAAGTRRVGIQVHLGAETAGTAPEPHCNKAVRGVQFGTWSTLPQFPHLRNGGSAGG